MKPTVSGPGYELYLGDCLPIIADLPREVAILTDPPYGMNYKPSRSLKNCHKWNSQKDFKPVMGDDKPFDPAPFLEFDKAILWGANHYASRLPDSAGWLTWDKRRGATISQGFIASDIELAWTSFLGTAKIFSHLWAGLCRDSEVGQHFHPTQKPVALMNWCLNFIPKEQIIFDPFAGSGTTGVACIQAGRRFIGIERDPDYFEIARQRLEAATGTFAAKPDRDFGGLFAEETI